MVELIFFYSAALAGIKAVCEIQNRSNKNNELPAERREYNAMTPWRARDDDSPPSLNNQFNITQINDSSRKYLLYNYGEMNLKVDKSVDRSVKFDIDIINHGTINIFYGKKRKE